MTERYSQNHQNTAPVQSSIWSRAFEEVQRARESNTAPNPEVFQNLTKSAGGN